MHFDKIEEYSFPHGLHFNTVTGEYYSLNPHDLGRPLTHEEMDYNLVYQKQTLNGWRIAGSGDDLRLTVDDLGKVLEFHRVQTTDDDWTRYSAAGLFDGQLAWIPIEIEEGHIHTTTLDPCIGFEIQSTGATDAGSEWQILPTTTQLPTTTSSGAGAGTTTQATTQATTLATTTQATTTNSGSGSGSGTTTQAILATTTTLPNSITLDSYSVSIGNAGGVQVIGMDVVPTDSPNKIYSVANIPPVNPTSPAEGTITFWDDDTGLGTQVAKPIWINNVSGQWTAGSGTDAGSGYVQFEAAAGADDPIIR